MPSPHASARKAGAPQKPAPHRAGEKGLEAPKPPRSSHAPALPVTREKKPRPPDDRLPADTKTPSQKPAPSKMETLENKTEKTQSKTSKGTTKKLSRPREDFA